jgi:ankyrin repeat protein
MKTHDSIYQAIRARDRNAVAAFLKAGADFLEDGGWTPIHEAAREGDLEILQMLIDGGFDVNDNFEITDYSSDYFGSALSEALLYGNLEAAKLLIRNGANVNGDFLCRISIRRKPLPGSTTW